MGVRGDGRPLGEATEQTIASRQRLLHICRVRLALAKAPESRGGIGSTSPLAIRPMGSRHHGQRSSAGLAL
eukprot:8885112-Alexandrium_andersonii.AAC.1